MKENCGYKKCKSCNGEGQYMRYPYYATIMPEKKMVKCEICKGRGRILVVPDRMTIIREGDYIS